MSEEKIPDIMEKVAAAKAGAQKAAEATKKVRDALKEAESK